MAVAKQEKQLDINKMNVVRCAACRTLFELVWTVIGKTDTVVVRKFLDGVSDVAIQCPHCEYTWSCAE